MMNFVSILLAFAEAEEKKNNNNNNNNNNTMPIYPQCKTSYMYKQKYHCLLCIIMFFF